MDIQRNEEIKQAIVFRCGKCKRIKQIGKWLFLEEMQDDDVARLLIGIQRNEVKINRNILCPSCKGN